MKFGSVDNPDQIDFSIPEDHPGTATVLSGSSTDATNLYVGCAKWNRRDLKNFYPRGTKDELTYYGSQFNCVELNATFYNTFDRDQIASWRDKVPENFKFFPKVNRYISHLKWLNGIEEATDDFIDSIVHFKEKLGTTFLQLRGNFKPKFFDRVASFVEYWPEGVPLAVEFRHPDWFDNEKVAGELYQLLEENKVANVITDTAGRRDLLHMRLTNSEAFVRYVGANHPTDQSRLDEWTQRLKKWTDQGLENIHFFVHQNKEKRSPQLAAHFIKQMNGAIGANLSIPNPGGDEEQKELF
ncbi:Uncharacterized conserved protein YecE, DUF72 family [Fodinibius roseus]|uniref:Uncharacterized conserved protein YecE, DUF72 family n=1 Tax=Fodinibius roseus TaxID=1194090 RepID=A0A1M5FRY1_9BACT|nr:DUF72 domain-containing protein [Fodinibius roseus]SHF94226.1 Uncharacterized conserved protein YecE, DUF72 family [Fodinibius roseus]